MDKNLLIESLIIRRKTDLNRREQLTKAQWSRIASGFNSTKTSIITIISSGNKFLLYLYFISSLIGVRLFKFFPIVILHLPTALHGRNQIYIKWVPAPLYLSVYFKPENCFLIQTTSKAEEVGEVKLFELLSQVKRRKCVNQQSVPAPGNAHNPRSLKECLLGSEHVKLCLQFHFQ